jgi:hypothetical protein
VSGARAAAKSEGKAGIRFDVYDSRVLEGKKIPSSVGVARSAGVGCGVVDADRLPKANLSRLSGGKLAFSAGFDYPRAQRKKIVGISQEKKEVKSQASTLSS